MTLSLFYSTEHYLFHIYQCQPMTTFSLCMFYQSIYSIQVIPYPHSEHNSTTDNNNFLRIDILPRYSNLSKFCSHSLATILFYNKPYLLPLPWHPGKSSTSVLLHYHSFFLTPVFSDPFHPHHDYFQKPRRELIRFLWCRRSLVKLSLGS